MHVQLELEGGRFSMRNGDMDFGSAQEFLDFYKNPANPNSLLVQPLVYIPVGGLPPAVGTEEVFDGFGGVVEDVELRLAELLAQKAAEE